MSITDRNREHCVFLVVLHDAHGPNRCLPASTYRAMCIAAAQCILCLGWYQALDKDLHSRTIAALGEDVVRAIQSSSVRYLSLFAPGVPAEYRLA